MAFIQIYIFAIQADAMLRQAAWTKAQYDPFFKVSSRVTDGGAILTVANAGQTPAYNFFIALRDDTEGAPLKHEEVTFYGIGFGEQEGHNLSVGRERRFLIRLSPEESHKRRITLRILYESVLGHLGEIQAVKFEGGTEFFMKPISVEPGFLLRAYEDLMLLLRWQFRYKRLLRK